MEWNVIDTYTRAEAIEDGVLIDITKTAKEVGINYPVALTQKLYSMVKDKPDTEDIEGRISDIAWMLYCSIIWLVKPKQEDKNLIYFKMILNSSNVDYNKPKEVTLKALVHGDDIGEPVITIMLPEED